MLPKISKWMQVGIRKLRKLPITVIELTTIETLVFCFGMLAASFPIQFRTFPYALNFFGVCLSGYWFVFPGTVGVVVVCGMLAIKHAQRMAKTNQGVFSE